jgi:histidine kinase
MFTIPGYGAIEKRYESSRSLIYRATRSSDGMPVMLKVMRQRYPSPATIARFQKEYEILRRFNLDGVVKAYELEIHQQNHIIVLEDFGGIFLQEWLRDHRFSLEAFLVVAIQLTSILGNIHQHQIIHKDINPSNILLAEGTVKFADFGIATVLSRETQTFCNPAVLEGTLAYISPEQTGRMNRAIDYRTDFYSLGITFYQMLCDRLPFEAADALQLLHCHIARQPIPPHEANPTIPRPVSDVVMKLLAKAAEDRYQSAYGISADLQECLNQLQQTQQIQSFPIGCRDISSTFQIPQKLYGRERDIKRLLDALERVSTGTELILVSGYSGTGKTTLVQELYKPITQQRGYFIAGKYEPLQRNIPYSALIQAFRELIQQLLTETEEQIQHWRERLLIALGENASVLIGMIPEVEVLIGQHSGALELPPDQTQHRFHFVLEQFIRVFAQPSDSALSTSIHPLIIFLDDLQWADNASLQLIRQWMTVFNNQHLLLIGAYRDHEVDAIHPLMRSLQEIQTSGGTISHITLSALNLADVQALIQDTFLCAADKALPMAELTLQKTQGNPFFINEFLKFLNQEGLIDFNSEQGFWQWNLQQIRAANLTDDVVELLVDRIQKLPAPSQHILSLSACIGCQFNLQLLARLNQQSLVDTAIALRVAIQENFIAPLGNEFQCLEFYPQSQTIELDVTYKFLHDRIQQTAYSLIPTEHKPRHHLKIGQLLLQSTPQELLEDRIFDITNHLNLGSELITDQNQNDELARLNLIAGRKAQTAIAYQAALNYLNQGRSRLAEDSWQNAYELTLGLCESAAKAAYLAGDFVQMEQRVEEVLSHARTALEKTNVYLVKIQARIAQEQFQAAIQTALEILDLIGITIPAQPDQAVITQGLTETKSLLASTQINDLIQLPSMTDPYKLTSMRIIASVCTPTYFLAPDLWKLMVFQKIQLSVNYGNAPGSAFGYADYGMIQCGMENNFEVAYQFSQLAAHLQPQLNAKEFVPKTALLVNMYLRHWREHLKETLNPLLEAYQRSLEIGDLEYGTFALAFRVYHSYLVGRELTQLEQEMASYEGAIAQFKQILPLNLIRIYWQSILNLIERSETPSRLLGNRYNEDENLPQLLAAHDKYLVFHLYLNKLILSYLFQETAPAADYAKTVDRLLAEGAVGLLVVPVFYFYDSLARIRTFPEASAAEQQQILRKVSANQAQMKQWADNAPMNYLHKFHLVEAERYRILEQVTEAADAYDLAIYLAKEHEYLNEESLANELAGQFYLARGKSKIAQVYLLEARYCYLRWGAIAKVSDLDQRYPQFFDRLLEQNPSLAPSPRDSTSSRSSPGTATLDLTALMKASQALSGEIVLEKLLAKLMTILLEHSGAQRGCLLLETQGKLCIEAEANTEPNDISVLQSIPLESEIANNHVSFAIVTYVARTQESLVLNPAFQDYRFHQDAYILNHQPKSILCTPLMCQGKRSGILYLENNLITDTFTPTRLEILQFLSAQAAISLDNAQLYTQLELRVQERTVELTQANAQLQTEILERQRSEQTLRMIVEGTAAVTGVDFFRSLVRSLAQALEVRYAFISECLESSCVEGVPTRVRSFAFWHGDEFGDAFEYDLDGTPCESVILSKGYQCFPAEIQTLFPKEKAELEAMEAQSYAGIALPGSAGNLLGHLAILDNQPMNNSERNQAVLEIFAARAAAEMERQQAEDALRISETKFSTAFRSSPDAITISTLNTGYYIEVNDSCLRMLGYQREEMIGRSILDLKIWANPDDRDAIKQRLQRQETVTNLELKLRRKSGELFPVLFSAEMIHLEDEPCLLAVAADITMLKQAEKALERLAEIGELAAMIVHEVRNPLTTISMVLTAFKRLELSERFQEYLSLSLDEADRLQRLLNQILLYSKQQVLQRSRLDLNGFIPETLIPLQASPAATGKQLKFISTIEPAHVLADPDKLKQILINLVTNACEAVNEGETITISLQTGENNQVRIQIHNGGTPIPADVLPNLTKPFFTTKVNGTGLGLAIVKRIVEAHEGEFSIESTVATGTIVNVQLPS